MSQLVDWETLDQSLPTSASSADYFQIGELLVCFGRASTGTTSSTPKTVTFPKAFAYAPKVFAAPIFQEGSQGKWTAWPASISAASASFQCGWVNATDTAFANIAFCWLAIGKAAS